MDKHEKENWKKVKDRLEQTGKTDNWFYKRAVAITSGKPDPLDNNSLES